MAFIQNTLALTFHVPMHLPQYRSCCHCWLLSVACVVNVASFKNNKYLFGAFYAINREWTVEMTGSDRREMGDDKQQRSSVGHKPVHYSSIIEPPDIFL